MIKEPTTMLPIARARAGSTATQCIQHEIFAASPSVELGEGVSDCIAQLPKPIIYLTRFPSQ
jgi:hypothetical protein